MINNNNVAMIAHGMHNGSLFIFSRTSLNAAFHSYRLLWVGVIHFGGFGT